jgi:colicin import membrane protein
MEAHDDGFRNGGDWLGLKLKARILIVTAMAVGFVLATPAQATAPIQKQVLRTPESAKAYAKTQLHNYGWNSKTQWDALHLLWTKESNWRPNAQNKTPVSIIKNGKKVTVYAGGIPQKLGLSPTVSVEKQIKVGLDYIKHRYGSPAKALAFWKLNLWY